MKKFLRYSWPVFALILIELAGAILRLQFTPIEGFEKLKYYPSQDFLNSLCWIYYLYTSPFTQAQKKSLISIIAFRLLVLSFSYENFWIEGGLKFGMGVLIASFYFLRTQQKTLIRKTDQAKLILCCIFFANSTLNFFLNRAYRKQIDVPWDVATSYTILIILAVVSTIAAVLFISIHIFMLYKLEDYYKAESQAMRIDEIGK